MRQDCAAARLSHSFPADADLVAGVPDSGLTAAMGYAKASGIPYEIIFHKNSYVGRTFIKPTQEERENSVRIKLNILEPAVRGKRIVLVDDSIVRGTTMKNLIRMLKKAGAKEIHVRVSSPPFLFPCYFGTDVPSNKQLIASSHSVEEICREIGADSLGYMPVEDLEEMAGGLPLYGMLHRKLSDGCAGWGEIRCIRINIAQMKRMCLGTFSRRARSLATCFCFARVRIIGTLCLFCVIGNSGNFLLHKKGLSPSPFYPHTFSRFVKTFVFV